MKTSYYDTENEALSIARVSKSALINVKNVRKSKAKTRGLCFLSTNRHSIQYYTHEQMIIGIHINNSKYVEEKFWNREMDILLDAVYNGFHYTLGLDKFNSERSLVIRCNNFAKYILNDNVV